MWDKFCTVSKESIMIDVSKSEDWTPNFCVNLVVNLNIVPRVLIHNTRIYSLRNFEDVNKFFVNSLLLLSEVFRLIRFIYLKSTLTAKPLAHLHQHSGMSSWETSFSASSFRLPPNMGSDYCSLLRKRVTKSSLTLLVSVFDLSELVNILQGTFAKKHSEEEASLQFSSCSPL